MSEVPQIPVSDLPDDAVLLDVREPDEWQAGHAPGAVHVPLADVPSRLGDLPEVDGPLPVVCRSGGRSGRAAEWLAQQGFEVANVDGGMRAWDGAGKTMTSENVEPPTVI
ncbi:rhodanese-like domain-containing protein [soil metagenome]